MNILKRNRLCRLYQVYLNIGHVFDKHLAKLMHGTYFVNISILHLHNVSMFKSHSLTLDGKREI